MSNKYQVCRVTSDPIDPEVLEPGATVELGIICGHNHASVEFLLSVSCYYQDGGNAWELAGVTGSCWLFPCMYIPARLVQRRKDGAWFLMVDYEYCGEMDGLRKKAYDNLPDPGWLAVGERTQKWQAEGKILFGPS